MKKSTKQELLHLFESGENQEFYLNQHLNHEMLYHLSPDRFNLLAFFDFQRNMSVLELGAKSGVIASSLMLLVAKVDLVEKDPDLAELCISRFSFTSQVNLIEEVNQQYDVVIMIDGLQEYSIEEALSYLKVGGTLLFSYENRFGLRYLNGGKDIYTNMMDINYSSFYSKAEIEAELIKLNLEYTFYYPYPDQYFTKEIYSDLRLPMPGDLYLYSNTYSKQTTIHFNEPLIREKVIQEGNFPLFANSYLVEVTKK